MAVDQEVSTPVEIVCAQAEERFEVVRGVETSDGVARIDNPLS
jgi:hypothetical protein